MSVVYHLMNYPSTTTPTSKDAEPLESVFERIRKGDEGAFEVFYDRLKRPLMAYCIAITGDIDSAKDAFHNTVLSVYENRNRYQNVNLMGWVFTIARNTSRNIEQREKRRVVIDESHLLPPENHENLDSDERALVQKAIFDLADDFRRVILLKYFGDMSVADIADAEDISIELVKTRLFRARKRLAEVLRIHFESYV